MLKKTLSLIAIVTSLTSSINAADKTTIGELLERGIQETSQKTDKTKYDAVAADALAANLTVENYLKNKIVCGLWLQANPIWQLQGLTQNDCSNTKAPWFKMPTEFIKNSKSILATDFMAVDILKFDPYDVGSGKFVCSFVGKIIQRVNKNSYILMGTTTNGTDVPFYLTNVPVGNYQIGSVYMGYVQKSQPYKYKATNGALQIVNAGNKVYGMTEFMSLEKMIRSGY
jgi:hypothetical protein